MNEIGQSNIDKFKIGNNYETLEFLGSDDTGVIYKAKNTIDNSIVSIKILKLELTKNEKFLVNLSQEINTVIPLEHKNIVKTIEMLRENDKSFIVMEYVDGTVLSDDLREKRFSIPESVEILKQLALALDYASSNSIIHRAIKPDEIFITKDKIVKISGFGFARAMATAWLTITGTTIANVEYMSPEQAEGEEIDHRTDIYSFGIIAYELLTGEVPFKREGSSVLSLAMKHINSVPEPLGAKNPDIPEWLETIIMKCLEKRPFNRFDNGNEIFLALENKNYKLNDFDTPDINEIFEENEKVILPEKSILREDYFSEKYEPVSTDVSELNQNEELLQIKTEMDSDSPEKSQNLNTTVENKSNSLPINQLQLKLLLLTVILLLFIVIGILFYIVLNR